MTNLNEHDMCLKMIFPNKPQEVEAIAHHYNSLDSFYLEIWGEHVHHGLWLTGNESSEKAVHQLILKVAEEAKIKKGDKVCDVGCGYGGTSRVLARDYGAQVVGFTLSESQFKYAVSKNRSPNDPQYFLQDWFKNDLADNSQDVVISVESSEHMVDKLAFFQEVHRVLKPGGRFVTCAWLANDSAKKWEVKYLLEPICREGRLPSIGTPSDYRKMMAHSGLVLENYTDLSRKVKKTWPLCIGRFGKGLLTQSKYRKFLLNSSQQDRVFAKTLFRLWAAYETKSMVYGLFSAIKPLRN